MIDENQDDDLVRKARLGDARAFGILIERHQKAVGGFLMSVLHDVDSAEDAAQQSFIRAFQSLKSFEGRSSFRTWVTRIAINEARSRLRWAKLRRWLPLEAPGVDRAVRWDESVRALRAPESENDLLDRKLDLERAMNVLTAREREIAAMRLEGYALEEIASALGISEGTVKSTLFSATRKMKERLS